MIDDDPAILALIERNRIARLVEHRAEGQRQIERGSNFLRARDATAVVRVLDELLAAIERGEHHNLARREAADRQEADQP